MTQPMLNFAAAVSLSSPAPKAEDQMRADVVHKVRNLLSRLGLSRYLLTVSNQFGEISGLTEEEEKAHRAVRAEICKSGSLVGEPDIVLRVPRHDFGSLFLELKTPRGELSDDQRRIHEGLRQGGNAVVVVRSVEHALCVVLAYLQPRLLFTDPEELFAELSK